jgi:hypothetical protein
MTSSETGPVRRKQVGDLHSASFKKYPEAYLFYGSRV